MDDNLLRSDRAKEKYYFEKPHLLDRKVKRDLAINDPFESPRSVMKTSDVRGHTRELQERSNYTEEADCISRKQITSASPKWSGWKYETRIGAVFWLGDWLAKTFDPTLSRPPQWGVAILIHVVHEGTSEEVWRSIHRVHACTCSSLKQVSIELQLISCCVVLNVRFLWIM